MNTSVKETKQCPSCGKPLPAAALAGLCPVCLLGQGAETESDAVELAQLGCQFAQGAAFGQPMTVAAAEPSR